MPDSKDAVLKTFYYQGQPFYELSSIMKIKDLQQQIDEINARMEALMAHCANNNYTMTDTHMRVVLGRISKATFQRLMRGQIPDGHQKWVTVALSDKFSNKDKKLVQERTDILQGWLDCGEMIWSDGVSVDKNPAGKIFLGKVFYDKQETGRVNDNKFSVEFLVKKKARTKN